MYLLTTQDVFTPDNLTIPAIGENEVYEEVALRIVCRIHGIDSVPGIWCETRQAALALWRQRVPADDLDV